MSTRHRRCPANTTATRMLSERCSQLSMAFGVVPRLTVHRAITQWREEREQKKVEAIRARLEAVQMQELNALAVAIVPQDEMQQRIAMLKNQALHGSMNFTPPYV